jgi:hypothetical protein
VEQVKQARADLGAGVLDLFFRHPAAEGPVEMAPVLELFAEKVLPRIRDV